MSIKTVLFLSKFIVVCEPDRARLAVATSWCLNTCWQMGYFQVCVWGTIPSFCTVCGLRASITVQSHKGLFSGSVLCSLLMIACRQSCKAPALHLLAVLVLSATHQWGPRGKWCKQEFIFSWFWRLQMEINVSVGLVVLKTFFHFWFMAVFSPQPYAILWFMAIFSWPSLVIGWYVTIYLFSHVFFFCFYGNLFSWGHHSDRIRVCKPHFLYYLFKGAAANIWSTV